MFRSTLDYIAQPLETVDVDMLRNAVVCGVTALVIVMVGFSKLLILVFYLLIIGVIATVTWLYSLERIKRAMVIERVKEVFNSLMRTCVDEVLKASGKDTVNSDPTGPIGDPIASNDVEPESGNRCEIDKPISPISDTDAKPTEDYSELFQ